MLLPTCTAELTEGPAVSDSPGLPGLLKAPGMTWAPVPTNPTTIARNGRADGGLLLKTFHAQKL